MVVAPLAQADGFETRDFGAITQQMLNEFSERLFGIGAPLDGPAPISIAAKGAASVSLARGLRARLVTSQVAQNGDMIAFWPSDRNPEWAIVCIENGNTIPGVQRIKLRGSDTGKVETILTGTIACDGIARTPWNTIIATEEVLPGGSNPAGQAIEIYDPLNTTGVAYNRVTGAATGGTNAANVVFRGALGRFSWEGLEVYADGTVYAGNELGPQKTFADSPYVGGALYKFVSTNSAFAACSAVQRATQPSCSPFAAGNLYVLQVGGTGNNVGQGNQYGLGKWLGPINPAVAVAEARALNATGYYRPEDLHADVYSLPAGAQRRVCWTNTGNSSINNYGEVLCLNERTNATDPTGLQPEVVQFVVGNPTLNQPDNLAFQPGTGIAYVIEDTPSEDVDGDGDREPHGGSVWACLPDGADLDTLTDGCVRVLSVKSGFPNPANGGLLDGAEPTGFTFDASGERAYLHIQHSPDDPATAANEGLVDDLLVIDGFRVKRRAY